MPSPAKGLLIRGGRLLDPSQGLDAVGDLFLLEGRVAWVLNGEVSRGVATIDARGLVVCPGFIDLHCHLRQPGFEEKETIATGTLAAARGGFTTVCAMPNTSPPADSRSVVEFILRTAATEGLVRVLPIACITRGQKGLELVEMGELAQAGAVGFSDDGYPVSDARLLRHAMEYSLAFGLPIIEHCEELALSEGGVMNEGWVSSRLGLRGIPAAAEETAVARDLALAFLTGARLHLAHLSTAGSVALIREARRKGLAVTAEVTPHHLTLTEERVMGRSGPPLSLDSYDTNAKVNPPLCTEADRQALVAALREGLIDAVATDHAPNTILDKECEFDLAAFGISGLETALGSLLTLVHRGELDLPTLVERLTAGPARVLGKPELGTLRPGSPADVTIFDPEREWVVEPSQFASKGKNTPWAGERLKGKVMATIYGGRIVYQDKSLLVEEHA